MLKEENAELLIDGKRVESDYTFTADSETMKDPNSNEPAVKPIEFEEMKFLARKLSQGVPFLRVDFYIIDHQVYFGELTFFHNAGFGPINPPEWNLKLGEMLNLENLKGKHSKNTYSKVF